MYTCTFKFYYNNNINLFGTFLRIGQINENMIWTRLSTLSSPGDAEVYTGEDTHSWFPWVQLLQQSCMLRSVSAWGKVSTVREWSGGRDKNHEHRWESWPQATCVCLATSDQYLSSTHDSASKIGYLRQNLCIMDYNDITSLRSVVIVCLNSSSWPVSILAPHMPPSISVPWLGLSLITCQGRSVCSSQSVTAAASRPVNLEWCVDLQWSVPDLPAVQVTRHHQCDWGVQHRDESPQHTKHLGQVSVPWHCLHCADIKTRKSLIVDQNLWW